MDRKPRTRTRTVKALTDPKPQRVSMVTGGANMTPFRALKAHDAKAVDNPANLGEEGASKAETAGASTMQPVANQENDTMAQATNIKATQDIRSLKFASTAFADEAAVVAWLDAGGYENYTILADDEGFVVSNKGEDEPNVATTEIALPNGVTFVITAPETNTVKSEAPAELRQKFDSWMASWHNEDGTIAEGLENGFDGIPPGVMELIGIFVGALSTCVSRGDMAGIDALCTEFGGYVRQLAALFPAPAKDEDDAMSNKMDMATVLGDIQTRLHALKDDIADKDVPHVTPNGVGGKKKKPPTDGSTDPNLKDPNASENEGGATDEEAKRKAATPPAQGLPTAPTKTVDAQSMPVTQTQMGGTPTGSGVDAPHGADKQPQGTPDGAKRPEEGEEQTGEAQAKGTPSGGTAPQGQTDAAQATGTPAGGNTPQGTTRDTQEHGTTSGGSLPAGDQRDAQPSGVSSAKTDTDPMAVIAAAMTTMADTLRTVVEGQQALKADLSTLTTRVEGVEGARQTRKGADITDVPSEKQGATSSGSKDSEYVSELRLKGALGIRNG